jgi:hypothetical protein
MHHPKVAYGGPETLHMYTRLPRRAVHTLVGFVECSLAGRKMSKVMHVNTTLDILFLG